MVRTRDYWFPKTEAANKNPVLSTQIDEVGGMVSKYCNITL